MIRALSFTSDGKVQTDLSIIDVAFALQNPGGMLWVDFQGGTPEEDQPILQNTFGFHPLAVDDALEESHVPKLDDWGKYLYIVLHTVIFDEQDGAHVDTLELDIFLGRDYIVTHHDQPIDAVERVWSSVQRDPRHLRFGVDHLLYRLADEIAASYMPVVEALDTAIDQLEAQLFDHPKPDTLERIFSLKRSVLHLRRIIAPQREVLNKLARDDFEVIDEQARVYFRDVYDHLVRLYDISESIRDLIGGTLDTYLSVINNHMNEIMKTLTIITSLFMPISFIGSFFGMNFFQPVIPLGVWTGKLSFLVTVGLTLAVPFTMFLWMRRRGWM
jgi:magnesium transporter